MKLREISLMLLALACLGAVRLRNHATTWEAAGLSVERVAVHHDVLPPRVISRLEHEALAVARTMRDDGTRYRFGKMATTWLGRGTDGSWPAARCAIELAIHRLFSLAFGASPAASRISGAEWWVQHSPSVNFHYDKDEALASEQMTMAFPEVSTVTYLSSRGDPTFVLDQTTPDGNHNEPTVPSDGWMVAPRRNAHLLFRGNLQHGVRGGLMAPGDGGRSGTNPAGAEAGASDGRLTLLINWWADVPGPPNCAPMSSADLGDLGVLLTEARVAELDSAAEHDAHGSTACAQRAAWRTLSINATNDGADAWRAIEVPPTDLIFVRFPATPLPRGNWAVHWGEFARSAPPAQPRPPARDHDSTLA